MVDVVLQAILLSPSAFRHCAAPCVAETRLEPTGAWEGGATLQRNTWPGPLPGGDTLVDRDLEIVTRAGRFLVPAFATDGVLCGGDSPFAVWAKAPQLAWSDLDGEGDRDLVVWWTEGGSMGTQTALLACTLRQDGVPACAGPVVWRPPAVLQVTADTTAVVPTGQPASRLRLRTP